MTRVEIPLSVDGLVTVLQEHGYTANKAQVIGALGNLLRRGVVRREGEAYEVRV